MSNMWCYDLGLIFCSISSVTAGTVRRQKPDCERVILFKELVTVVERDFIEHEFNKHSTDKDAELITIENYLNPIIMHLNKTVVNNRGERVILPLVLKANITRLTLIADAKRNSSDVPEKVRRNVARMLLDPKRTSYHAGQLIAYQNGGPRDVVNFLPQSIQMNSGPWKAMESVVNQAARAREMVTMTIVIYYDETVKTLPVVLGVRLEFSNEQGQMFSEQCEMLFENCLGNDCSGRKRTKDVIKLAPPATKRRS